MNRKLRAALWIVAVVSIAIALYYPVTQYLEGKALDDEMLKLRRMKTDAMPGTQYSELLPVQTGQFAVPAETPGVIADPGPETSGVGVGKTKQNAKPGNAVGGSAGLPEKPDAASTDRMVETDETDGDKTDRAAETNGAMNAVTDRMAEPDETSTDRMADPNEVAVNTTGETVMANGTAGDGDEAGRKANADEPTGGTTCQVAAIQDTVADKTDRSMMTFDTATEGMPDRSGATGSNRESDGTYGVISEDSADNAGGCPADFPLKERQSSGAGAIETRGADAPAANDKAAATSDGTGEPDKLSNPEPARDAGGIGGKQTEDGQTVSPVPDAMGGAPTADESAFGDTSFTAESTPAPTTVSEPEPALFVFDESRILPEYKALYEENRDLVGWLKIDGTMVDYPVLQRADEEYYLTRDFYGRSNSNGQLILDAQCDPFTPDVNLVISGHDMKSGKMFGTLQRYASERFGRQHPIIEFDTLFRRGRYRLVAAFQTWDYLKREDGFRYNVDIRYRLELKKYLEELDRIKLYDTGVPVEFGDQLITLSTCSTQTDDGRFVVVARRLRDGEQP